MTSVAIIIPFYQLKSGVLTRALDSVRQQVIGSTAVRVIIVDDASPLSAEQELAETGFIMDAEWEVITKSNGGPGSARNTALDRLTDNPPDFVAFLDSDDVWAPDHLDRAMRALAGRADFYGSDHQRLNEAATYFSARPEVARTLNRLGKSRVIGTDAVFEMESPDAIQAFAESYLVQTSTVVYRWAALSAVRFDESLRTAGEDRLFWLDSAAAAQSCTIDLALGSTCMDGVNIYENAMSWDSPAAIKRAAYQLIMWAKAKKRFAGNERAVAVISAELKSSCQFFMFLWLRALAQRRETNVPLLREVLNTESISLGRLIAGLPGLVSFRLRKSDFTIS